MVSRPAPKKLLSLAAIILGVGFWLFSRPDNEIEKIRDLSPVAFAMFDSCIDAARLSDPLSEEQLTSKIATTFNGIPQFAGGKVTLNIGEDFECFVTIPHQSYDPVELRKELEASKLSRFDDRTRSCSWSNSQHGSPTSMIVCSLKSVSKPGNSFQVTAGIIALEGAFFSVQPRLIYSTDGTVRLVN